MLKQASKSQLGIAIALLLGLCAAAGYWVFSSYYEYYEEPAYLGHSQRYEKEEWLAADRFLEGLGTETVYYRRVPDFESLPSDQSLFGGDLVNLLTRGQIRDLMRWVERGGQLIFAVQNDNPSHLKKMLGISFSDYSSYDDYDEFEDEDSDQLGTQGACSPDETGSETDPTAGELEDQAISAKVEQQSDCVEQNEWRSSQVTTVNFEGSDGDYQLVLPSNYSLEHRYIYDEEFEDEDSLSPFYWAGSDSAGSNFMQFYHGDGLISVLTSDSIWLNESIAELDAAHVLGILVHGKLNVLEHGNIPSLGEIIWRYGSEFVVALLLLILLWIAHHIRRFGPILSDHSQTRRSLSDHIAASSAHHWKLKNTARLINPLQQQLQRAAIKHSPGYGGLTPEKQTRALIEMSGFPDALCQAAMDTPQTTEAEFVIQVSALKHLIERLNQGQ
jgi:hypothetical protein